MDRIHRPLLLMGFIILLPACAGAPSAPYWEDQKWNESLFNAVQQSVHYPGALTEEPSESVEGEVGFTYTNGRIEDATLVKSTGSQALDAVLLQQVRSAKVPPAIGSHAGESRHFELSLKMLTPMQDFYDRFQITAQKSALYPKEAILSGDTGAVVIGLDYQDGIISNAQVMQSSGHVSLDRAALRDIKNLDIPPPVNHIHDHLHFSLQLCYSLKNKGGCPTYRSVIQVVNTP
ncbi:MAG TPA: TonB family protein [Gammaproteobacteria bacterium]|nr:TonB family protein [Gammaproteobacteria bacterium]